MTIIFVFIFYLLQRHRHKHQHRHQHHHHHHTRERRNREPGEDGRRDGAATLERMETSEVSTPRTRKRIEHLERWVSKPRSVGWTYKWVISTIVITLLSSIRYCIFCNFIIYHVDVHDLKFAVTSVLSVI